VSLMNSVLKPELNTLFQMVIEGEIQSIPSSLPWSVVQSGIRSQDSEESILDVFRAYFNCSCCPRTDIMMRYQVTLPLDYISSFEAARLGSAC